MAIYRLASSIGSLLLARYRDGLFVSRDPSALASERLLVCWDPPPLSGERLLVSWDPSALIRRLRGVGRCMCQLITSTKYGISDVLTCVPTHKATRSALDDRFSSARCQTSGKASHSLGSRVAIELADRPSHRSAITV